MKWKKYCKCTAVPIYLYLSCAQVCTYQYAHMLHPLQIISCHLADFAITNDIFLFFFYLVNHVPSGNYSVGIGPINSNVGSCNVAIGAGRSSKVDFLQQLKRDSFVTSFWTSWRMSMQSWTWGAYPSTYQPFCSSPHACMYSILTKLLPCFKDIKIFGKKTVPIILLDHCDDSTIHRLVHGCTIGWKHPYSNLWINHKLSSLPTMRSAVIKNEKDRFICSALDIPYLPLSGNFRSHGICKFAS